MDQTNIVVLPIYVHVKMRETLYDKPNQPSNTHPYNTLAQFLSSGGAEGYTRKSATLYSLCSFPFMIISLTARIMKQARVISYPSGGKGYYHPIISKGSYWHELQLAFAGNLDIILFFSLVTSKKLTCKKTSI